MKHVSLNFKVLYALVELSIFICENNRKSNEIMHCVDFFDG